VAAKFLELWPEVHSTSELVASCRPDVVRDPQTSEPVVAVAVVASVEAEVAFVAAA